MNVHNFTKCVCISTIRNVNPQSTGFNDRGILPPSIAHGEESAGRQTASSFEVLRHI